MDTKRDEQVSPRHPPPVTTPKLADGKDVRNEQAVLQTQRLNPRKENIACLLSSIPQCISTPLIPDAPFVFSTPSTRRWPRSPPPYPLTPFATQFGRAVYIRVCASIGDQSLETTVGKDAVSGMEAHMGPADLVVGAALTGHAFQGGDTVELTGVTTPWNTLALWDVAKLAKLGCVGSSFGDGRYFPCVRVGGAPRLCVFVGPFAPFLFHRYCCRVPL